VAHPNTPVEPTDLELLELAEEWELLLNSGAVESAPREGRVEPYRLSDDADWYESRW